MPYTLHEVDPQQPHQRKHQQRRDPATPRSHPSIERRWGCERRDRARPDGFVVEDGRETPVTAGHRRRYLDVVRARCELVARGKRFAGDIRAVNGHTRVERAAVINT